MKFKLKEKKNQIIRNENEFFINDFQFKLYSNEKVLESQFNSRFFSHLFTCNLINA